MLKSASILVALLLATLPAVAQDSTVTLDSLKAEVEQLKQENSELKQRITKLEKRTGQDDSATGSPKIELPSQQDMDRVMTMVEAWVRRFLEFARSLAQEPAERKNI